MRSVFTVLLVFLTVFCSAQNMNQFDYYNRFKKMVPSTPNASALMNFTSFSQSSYTGVPAIQIPIYNIELKDFSIPVTLSYNAGGIKVEDVPSLVGSGWSLEVGGEISRNVQGSSDDKFIDESGSGCGATGSTNVRNVGYLLGGLDSLLTFNDNQPDELKKSVKLGLLNGFPCQNWDADLNVIPSSPGSSGRRMDMQPDFFFLNILGKSYKLFFYKNAVTGTFRCLAEPYSTLQINYTMDTDLKSINPNGQVKMYSLGLTKFDIVDGKGNRFLFDLKDSVQQYTESGHSGVYEKGIADWGSRYQLHSYSSWHLTNIITANNDTVKFTYQAENYQTPTSTSYKVRGNFSGTIESGFESFEFSKARSYITAHRLTGIETKDHIIQFAANLARTDLTGSNALTDIVVTSRESGRVIKKFRFSYDYFVSSGNAFTDGGDLLKRLKLLSFREISSDETIMHPYHFTYYETPSLPARNSRQQDFWGYYNGNGANIFIPKIYVYPNLSGLRRLSIFKNDVHPEWDIALTDGAVDRNTSASFIHANSLKQIQYPTGGTEEYQYEPNEFFDNYWSSGRNRIVGGMRIKKIIKKDNQGGIIDRTYTYFKSSDPSQSSGRLLQYPYYAHIENTYAYGSHNSASQYASNSLDYFRFFTFRSSHPRFNTAPGDNAVVGYTEVTESITNNGYSVYQYAVNTDFSKMSDIDNDNDCSETIDGFCDSLYRVPEIKWVRDFVQCNAASGNPPQLIGSTPNLTNLDIFFNQSAIIPGNVYPFLPSTNYNWNRGLLLGEKTFDNNNKLIKEKKYTYTSLSKDSIFYVPGLFYTGAFNDYNRDANWPCNPGSFGQRGIIYYAKYNFIANASKLTQNVQDITYDQTKSLKVTNSYDYYPQNRNLKTSVFVKSNGAQEMQFYTYPFSSTTLNTTVKNELLNRNQKDIVIDYEKKIGAISVQKVVNGFAVNNLNNLPYGDNIKLYSNDVLTNEIAVLSVDKYNTVKDYREKDFTRSYIWNSTSSNVIAEAKNAAATDIAYSSFEFGDNGNWTIASPARTNNYALTGKKCYMLSSSDISKSGLSATKTYKLSYWTRNGSSYNITGTVAGSILTGKTVSGWTFFEHTITGLTTVTITGSGYVDELRLLPAGSQMSTYTYDPLVGMTSQTDINNRIIYYEYDGNGRLMLIRDQDKNILKKFCYNYAGQTENCDIFYNAEKAQVFTKTGCESCTTPGSIVYTVPANKYLASTQVEANALAQSEIDQNGQNEANKGTCIPVSPAAINSYNATTYNVSVSFYNTTTYATYNYTAPNGSNSQGPTIPCGNYNITMSPGVSGNYTYYINGYSKSTSETANFYNIPIGGNVSMSVNN